MCIVSAHLPVRYTLNVYQISGVSDRQGRVYHGGEHRRAAVRVYAAGKLGLGFTNNPDFNRGASVEVGGCFSMRLDGFVPVQSGRRSWSGTEEVRGEAQQSGRLQVPPADVF